jgi:hypothetical protein
MRLRSRRATHRIATALVVAAGAAVSLPPAAPAAPREDGPVVLYTRGAAQRPHKEVAGPPAPSKKDKPSNPPGAGGGAKDGQKEGAEKAPKEPASPLFPGPGTAPKEVGDNGQVDPISGLGLRNPTCDHLDQIRDRLTRVACETNGTPESHYPPTNYGFDTFIDTGVDAPMGTGLSIIVWLLNGVWLGVNFVLRCVFELLGLAFGLNPFGKGETMRELSSSINRLYWRITNPWLSTLVVMGGIWFAYKGLVRREIGASVSGTLAAIAMLVVGLWIVHSPAQTVGRLANMSNQMSLGVISAPQAGSVSRPMGSFAEAMSATWPKLIEVPFAGLNFSDVSWAMGPPPEEAVEKANEKLCDDVGTEALFEATTNSDGDVDKACEEYVHNRYGKPKRVIDLYLRSSPNSPPREALWQYFDKDEGDRYKAKVAAQGGDGVLTRLSMLALFLVGLFGALMLLAWLALRLFTQAAIGFVLLLAAPLALFFPLLGDAGRRAFKTWGLTLLGATIAKVVYAAFLSIVLMGIATLGRPGGAIGFLLTAAFCWTVFLKRAELIKLLSVGDVDAKPFSVPSQIAALALGRRALRTATGAVTEMVRLPNQGGPPRRPQQQGSRGERRPNEKRETLRKPEVEAFASNARGLGDRGLADPRVAEARETVADTWRKYGDPRRWQQAPAAGAGRAADAGRRAGANRSAPPKGARSSRPEPNAAEVVRYEKAEALLDHAQREAQVRKGQGTRGAPDAPPPTSEHETGRTPRDYARRFEIDRERLDGGSRAPSREEKRGTVERKTMHDVHLLHAAMEASDPSLGRGAQLAEEGQRRSEEKRNPRPGNVRRVSRFRQLHRPYRDRPRAPRKDMSRGG